MKILRKSGCNINCINRSCCTAFYAACHEGQYEIVKYLIECEEIDKNKRNCRSETSFWIACERGFVRIVRLLLENGVNIETSNESGLTPFEVACLNERWLIVSFLLNIGVIITDKCFEYVNMLVVNNFIGDEILFYFL